MGNDPRQDTQRVRSAGRRLPSLVFPALAFLATVASLPLGSEELDLLGNFQIRGVAVDAPSPWIEGGFGRFTEGRDASGDWDVVPRAIGQLGLDWSPTANLRLHAHGLARWESDESRGDSWGLVEAFARWSPEPTPTVRLRLQAGLFFPETSRENVDPLWATPYTITYSAWNSWIADELRLAGVDAAVVWSGDGRSALLGATVFGGADTAGALLSWRGFTWGDRLTVVGEVLPLPPLPTLDQPGPFWHQRDDGTRGIDELDGRAGYMVRARFGSADAIVQADYLDTRGDQGLHSGQYAWATRFAHGALELHLGPATLLGEGARGTTEMGPYGGPRVDVEFTAAYALLSVSGKKLRASGRIDYFDVDDRDGTAEPNEENGHGWTLALLWTPVNHLRLAAEYLDGTGDRPAAAFSGADPKVGGRRAVLELRVVF